MSTSSEALMDQNWVKFSRLTKFLLGPCQYNLTLKESLLYWTTKTQYYYTFKHCMGLSIPGWALFFFSQLVSGSLTQNLSLYNLVVFQQVSPLRFSHSVGLICPVTVPCFPLATGISKQSSADCPFCQLFRYQRIVIEIFLKYHFSFPMK